VLRLRILGHDDASTAGVCTVMSIAVMVVGKPGRPSSRLR
jgi:hypothetical protein